MRDVTYLSYFMCLYYLTSYLTTAVRRWRMVKDNMVPNAIGGLLEYVCTRCSMAKHLFMQNL